MSVKSLVKQVLVKKQNMIYQRQLSDVCLTYGDWYKGREKKLLGQESALSDPDFIPVKIFEGEFTPYAFSMINEYFSNNPECILVYGDEDVLSGKKLSVPWFKPDWSPELFETTFYLGSFVAIRKGVDFDFGDGSFEEKMEKISKLISKHRAFQKKSECIGHISEILYHTYLKHDKADYSLTDKVREESSGHDEGISIVIPSKDNPTLIEKCLNAIATVFNKYSYEVIIVDNGSSPANKPQIEAIISAGPKVKYIYSPMEFNFSKMCNMGAEMADYNNLLFLNDDVELLSISPVDKMVELSKRPNVGAVGIKLLYPDSTKIQHAGIINLPMGPVHKLQFCDDTKEYYDSYNRGIRNVLAVTAACVMIQKCKFDEVGGFYEGLKVAFNDVDLCFKLHEAGYRNVCVNEGYAYHHESLTRGNDESDEKLKRLLGEKDKLYERHPHLVGSDPYYSVHLNRNELDTLIRPGYLMGISNAQVISEKNFYRDDNLFSDFRQDACVLVRVESVIDSTIQGYAVVLGDNNACYDKWLVLKRADRDLGENKAESYRIKLVGKYRPDLVENMPDQTNVGLCGFKIRLDKKDILPAGKFVLGVAVKNKVTGLGLVNMTNRDLEI